MHRADLVFAIRHLIGAHDAEGFRCGGAKSASVEDEGGESTAAPAL